MAAKVVSWSMQFFQVGDKHCGLNITELLEAGLLQIFRIREGKGSICWICKESVAQVFVFLSCVFPSSQRAGHSEHYPLHKI
jgi:hypothetical protein